MESSKRMVEVFSAGCPACEPAVDLVTSIACSSCEVQVRDMRKPEVAERARSLGIDHVPAVVIDGRLAACCATSGITEAALRAEGLGQPL